METLATIILTAILSPMACFMVYVFLKAKHDINKILRRNEFVEAIKSDYVTQAAITRLITDKMKDDYVFQQAITTLVITQLEKDWQLERAVLSIANRSKKVS